MSDFVIKGPFNVLIMRLEYKEVHVKSHEDPQFAQRVSEIEHMGQINLVGINNDFRNVFGNIGNRINIWKRKKERKNLLTLVELLKEFNYLGN